jgi:aspartyl-tRNA(Asn)/glutamyl-tRNA(Gln) amidotransferase subunit A
VAAAVRRAVSVLEGLGAGVTEVSVPYLDQHCASYYVNVLSEASANLARYDGIRYGLRRPQATSAKGVMLDSRGAGFGEVSGGQHITSQRARASGLIASDL